MKKLIITLAALIMMGATSASAATQAQTQAKSQPKTEQVTGQQQGKKVKNNGKPTGHTYKGYPVYQGSKGGYYVIRVSKKSGNEYKQYIKPEQFDK